MITLRLTAILVVSLNLRGAITSVAPVMPEIRADLDLSSTEAGLLTALPVLCFALLAPASAWLGRRIGLDRAIMLSCIAIAAATAGRVLGGVTLLFLATLMIGAAMTVGNVLVPVVVKRDFADQAGQVTGLYTAAFIVGAASAAGLTAPLAAVTNWRFAVGIWALLGVAAAIVWSGATRESAEPPSLISAQDARLVRLAVWRSPVAWSVATLFGAQAAGYYAVTAWLPSLLVDEVGVSLALAGIGMAVFQLTGIAGTLAIASLVDVRSQQVWLAGLVAALWLAMLLGLVVMPAWWPVWGVIGGLGQGAGISLALSLVALRSYDTHVAQDMSAMVQFVGYLSAAGAPLVVGTLHDATGSWRAPLLLLAGIAACIGVAGLVGGRDTTIRVAQHS